MHIQILCICIWLFILVSFLFISVPIHLTTPDGAAPGCYAIILYCIMKLYSILCYTHVYYIHIQSTKINSPKPLTLDRHKL